MDTSLYLFPTDAFSNPPAVSRVLDVLTKTGLLGRPLDATRFLTGDGFFRHISFAGCSPSMQLQPPEDGSNNFTHISLSGPFDPPILITTKHHSRPRCPHCGQRLNDWKSELLDWQQDPTAEVICTGCHLPSAAGRLNWRRYAACGRLLVEIHQVFPGEAVPSDSLMNELENSTGCEWRYAWADGSCHR